jgi:hypothetical protein
MLTWCATIIQIKRSGPENWQLARSLIEAPVPLAHQKDRPRDAA